MYHYLLTEEADEDLLNIYDYSVYYWGEEQAIKYVSTLMLEIENLCSNPLIATKRDELGANKFSFPMLQHIIYFRINEDCITVWAILHKSSLPYYEL